MLLQKTWILMEDSLSFYYGIEENEFTKFLDSCKAHYFCLVDYLNVSTSYFPLCNLGAKMHNTSKFW